MAKEHSQSDRRRYHKMIDQHGRDWETTLDFIANGPCAPITPRFNSPLDIPSKYVKFNPEDTARLRIDYDPWIADLEEAHRDWDRRLYDDAIMLFGAQGPRAYKDRVPELTRHTGPAPTPVDLVKGAKAGNKFMLGLTDKMPAWAEALIPKVVAVVEEFPDADEIDKYGDFEEETDPEAIGGKVTPKKNARQRLNEAA